MAMLMPQMQPPTLIIFRYHCKPIFDQLESIHTHHHAESHQVGAMAILMPQMQPPTLIIFRYHCLMP